jgi:8-oxo-dGTP pyrophosphatase MutT (NUDIX family)
MKHSTQIRRKTISCGACVYRIVDDSAFEVLLVRPWAERDAWGIPKGHLNEGEALEACALREVQEEAGISVQLEDRLLPVSTNYGDEQKTVHAWIAKQTSPEKAYAHDGENVDVRWFKHNLLPNLHVYQRPLLAQAIKMITHKIMTRDEDYYIPVVEGENLGESSISELKDHADDVKFVNDRIMAALGIPKEYMGYVKENKDPKKDA